MTAGHTTHRLPKVNAGPAPLAALLAASLLTGGALGAVITRQIDSANSGAAAVVAAGHGSAFDAAAFRAGERAPLAVPFDAAAFRAGERAPLAVPFDAAAFRAGERAPLAVPFDAAAFRAGERAPLSGGE